MNVFQATGLIVLGILFAWTSWGILTDRPRMTSGLFWLSIWSTAGYALLHPETLTHAAHLLGIDRGADLVSYLTTLALLLGFFLVYRGYRSIQSQLTVIVREIALLKNELQEHAPPTNRSSPPVQNCHDAPPGSRTE